MNTPSGMGGFPNRRRLTAYPFVDGIPPSNVLAEPIIQYNSSDMENRAALEYLCIVRVTSMRWLPSSTAFVLAES